MKVALSNISLDWVVNRIRQLGLGLELDFSTQPDAAERNYLKDFTLDIGPIFRLTGLINRVIDPGDVIHESALQRFLQKPQYQPTTLVNGLRDQVRIRQLVRLQSGESRSFSVDAAKLWNPSDILLEPSNLYDIEVQGDQTWTDLYIPTDADGYRREALRPWEFLRRVPDQNWFKLIGTIGRDEKAPIGIGKSRRDFSPSRSGELLCFANDVAWMYWNNRGSVRVTVTRVK